MRSNFDHTGVSDIESKDHFRSRRKILLSSGLILALPACTQVSTTSKHDVAVSEKADHHDVSIRFGGHKVQTSVDTRFVGLSYEKSKLLKRFFAAENTQLVNLFKLLGPSVLRIGGNSVDTTFWGGNVVADRQIPHDNLNTLAQFVRATGWQVIYGINLAKNTPILAAEEARLVAQALGESLLAFEIGNEPDLYARHDVRPANWHYEDFVREWNSMANAIRKSVPNAVFSGPASAGMAGDFTLRFAGDERASISMLTQHYYRGDGKSTESTVSRMLSHDKKLEKILSELNSAASNAKIAQGYRIAECNSFYNGGAPNISNSYASALWVADFSLTCAIHKSSGINLHSGGKGPGYTPISEVTSTAMSARPGFYGALFVSQAFEGKITEMISDNRDHLTAYHLTRGDRGVNIILINKSPSQHAKVDVQTKSNHNNFSLLTLERELQGQGEQALLGGAKVDGLAGWSPQNLPKVTAQDQRISIVVPPYSAMLLRSV